MGELARGPPASRRSRLTTCFCALAPQQPTFSTAPRRAVYDERAAPSATTSCIELGPLQG
eukprot:7732732-Pyramimonas_sp.AAC.1